MTCLGLGVITVLAFFGVWRNGFVDYDDNTYVFLNPNVIRGIDWQTLEWASTHVNACHWVPLTWLSHALDCQIFGLNPAGHHLTSLILHVVNVVLLFLLWQMLTGSLWRSAIVAALFGVHPLRVESVAWVAERKDVLSGFFFLLTLIAYVRDVAGERATRLMESKHAAPPGSGKRSAWYWWALVFFACGLLSKPMLVTVPCVLLLLDYWPLKRFEVLNLKSQTAVLRALLIEKAPFFALAGVVSVITFLAQENTRATAGGAAGIPAGMRLANAVLACTNYLTQTFWPVKLAVFYPPQRATLFQPAVLAGLVLLAVLTWVAWRVRVHRPYATMGWLWFIGVLVPVSGIVQAGEMIQADRFTYLPSIGLFILLVWGVGALVSAKPGLRMSATLLAGLIIITFAFQTLRQVEVWKDTETLFSHAAKVTHDNHVALVTLADFDVRRGQMVEATAKVERALSIAPNFPRAEYLKATILQMQGKMQEAIPHLERSVGPEVFIPSRARMVLSLLGTGQLSAADALLEQLLQVMSGNPDAWLMKAALLREQGRTAEAVELFHRITQSHPPQSQDTPLFNYEIAELFCLGGQSARAPEFYDKAISAHPEFTNALNNFAWLLATDPVAGVRNGSLAVQYAERACELTQWKQPVFMGTLAAAYAEAGRFDDAVKTAERARDRAKALGSEAIANRNQELLEIYRQRKPFHEEATPKRD